jgi:hypothetical protein
MTDGFGTRKILNMFETKEIPVYLALNRYKVTILKLKCVFFKNSSHYECTSCELNISSHQIWWFWCCTLMKPLYLRNPHFSKLIFKYFSIFRLKGQ